MICLDSDKTANTANALEMLVWIQCLPKEAGTKRGSRYRYRGESNRLTLPLSSRPPAEGESSTCKLLTSVPPQKAGHVPKSQCSLVLRPRGQPLVGQPGDSSISWSRASPSSVRQGLCRSIVPVFGSRTKKHPSVSVFFEGRVGGLKRKRKRERRERERESERARDSQVQIEEGKTHHGELARPHLILLS